ncbi:hypothetical protein Agabi119p4_6547 [Agaricus bisporus var. burnettii]|uniref:CRAL-TRIO domain-containing protein n=1 Tax=Agaricus bisporus var. burnettii TaxID=192524 RepID=A0A8H7F055_AGABI|nr:hypothetical protein Agabi119p4_6547 [Agaricus bisporus var. burnettii]
MAKTKVYTVSLPPDGLYKKDPLPPLTERERKTYTEVSRHFLKGDYKIPGTPNGELSEDEKFWLSYECILRFLRGSRWKALDTIQRLEATLKWRRDFGLYTRVNASLVEKEAVTGNLLLLGHDTQGRPAFYLIPNRQSTTGDIKHIQSAIFMLERCIDLMPPGVETLDFLITFTPHSSQPPFSFTRTLLSTLQTHYPERLAFASITNPPLMLNIMIKFVLTFIDPITRAKCKFDPKELLRDRIFKPEGLMKKWWGGGLDFEFEHERYWPELIELTEARTAKWKERWRELGGRVGIREWLYKRPSGTERESVDMRNGKNGDLAASLSHQNTTTVSPASSDEDCNDHKLLSPWVLVDEP